mmetsp:Transcript_16478/g.29179  ORF Transcript_16478/g.29179 Transcript_16478/m.29179 type:complete len:259 (+) Transcript_16478:115-891(+)
MLCPVSFTTQFGLNDPCKRSSSGASNPGCKIRDRSFRPCKNASVTLMFRRFGAITCESTPCVPSLISAIRLNGHGSRNGSQAILRWLYVVVLKTPNPRICSSSTKVVREHAETFVWEITKRRNGTGKPSWLLPRANIALGKKTFTCSKLLAVSNFLSARFDKTPRNLPSRFIVQNPSPSVIRRRRNTRVVEHSTNIGAIVAISHGVLSVDAELPPCCEELLSFVLCDFRFKSSCSSFNLARSALVPAPVNSLLSCAAS